MSSEFADIIQTAILAVFLSFSLWIVYRSNK
jgi:hypothetical protein